MNSPTQRSLKYLRDKGYLCQVVEHWNQFAHIRQDLFGFIDIVALRGSDGGILGVQTTSDSHVSERVKKTLGLLAHKQWLDSGGAIEIHGWGKKGARGKVKKWQVRIETI